MHSSRVDISIRNLKWELIWCERITEKKHVLALCGGCTSSVRSFEGPLLLPRVAPPTKMIKKSEKIKTRVTLGESRFRVWVSPPAWKDFFSFCALCNFGTVLILWCSVYAELCTVIIAEWLMYAERAAVRENADEHRITDNFATPNERYHELAKVH